MEKLDITYISTFRIKTIINPINVIIEIIKEYHFRFFIDSCLSTIIFHTITKKIPEKIVQMIITFMESVSIANITSNIMSKIFSIFIILNFD